MVLPIVKYGDPVLRKKGARIEKVTPEVRRLIEDMIATMRHANGVGLAAQQIGQAVQLAIVDVSEVEDRPSWMEIEGKRVTLEDFMPLVVMNPEITPVGKPAKGPEGCLSFPELYADIERPESVDVRALDAEGKTMHFRCGGLLARAIQHEADHLNGILFIDRMSTHSRRELKPDLDALQAETKARLQR